MFPPCRINVFTLFKNIFITEGRNHFETLDKHMDFQCSLIGEVLIGKRTLSDSAPGLFLFFFFLHSYIVCSLNCVRGMYALTV